MYFPFLFLSSDIVGTFFPSCWKAYTEYKEGNHMKWTPTVRALFCLFLTTNMWLMLFCLFSTREGGWQGNITKLTASGTSWGDTHSTLIQSVWPLNYAISWKEGGCRRRRHSSIILKIFHYWFTLTNCLLLLHFQAFPLWELRSYSVNIHSPKRTL